MQLVPPKKISGCLSFASVDSGVCQLGRYVPVKLHLSGVRFASYWNRKGLFDILT